MTPFKEFLKKLAVDEWVKWWGNSMSRQSLDEMLYNIFTTIDAPHPNGVFDAAVARKLDELEYRIEKLEPPTSDKGDL